ncbi:3'-5' exonuclease [Hydrogenobacter hydrogenophilus]|uniref:DNA polymerase-3 subunit epsilon n=1 Tax=Hydrogenobacter hydrogenophilus TaxID=35835 RepID=A0A285NPR9_9AQUI|nr:3'-5' exonuclease [Hydrogenobacter hydrogenophilus]SNZ10967.1 DNA polymerase-3 subunit epsilon [Hydrogenobacter hydrogenophilus]
MILLDRCIRYVYERVYGERFYRCNWDVDLNLTVSDTTFVVCDTETTGLDIKKDEPIAIGALKIRALHLDLSEKFYRLLKPKKLPDRSSIEIHGITPSDLTSVYTQEDVGKDLLNFAKGSVLVGYFFHFDLEMIRKLLKDLCPSIFLPYFIDVLDLYPGEKPSDMESMLSALGIPLSARHSALEDAYMTALIFLKLIKPYEKKKLKAVPLRVL